MYLVLHPQGIEVIYALPAIQVFEGFSQGNKKPHEAQKLHTSGKARL